MLHAPPHAIVLNCLRINYTNYSIPCPDLVLVEKKKGQCLHWNDLKQYSDAALIFSLITCDFSFSIKKTTYFECSLSRGVRYPSDQIQFCFTQDSIQNIIQLKKICWFNSKDNSIQQSWNHWYWSNRKNAQKLPKKCPK